MFYKIQLVFHHYQVICSLESFLRWTLIPQGIFHLHKIVSVLQIISVCSSCLKDFAIVVIYAGKLRFIKVVIKALLFIKYFEGIGCDSTTN